ncbi:MAG: DHHW family protein [Bacteroidota bacterium]
MMETAAPVKKKTDRQIVTASYVHLCLMVSALSVMGILFFLMPKHKVSVYENRNLARFPQFSTHALMEGIFLDSVDLFYADNFPFRDRFVAFSSWLSKRRGLRSEEVGFYIAPKKAMTQDTALIAKSDSIAPGDTALTRNNGGEEMNTNLLIYKGMALDLFGGSLAMEKAYAAAINNYADVLKGKNVYSIIVPTHSEFAMPPEYKKMTGRQKTCIDNVNTCLAGNIKKVDAYAELEAHKDEYIYFNTDHHWTALGAYYAYKAFCASAGFTPIDLQSNLRYTGKKFLGSQYHLTLDDRLKANPDSFYYVSIPMKFKAEKYLAKSPDKPSPAFLVAPGYANYGSFLGGDFPLMKVQTELKNGRKAVLVKNSFGNAFAPYLASHYEEVYIIDYRYYKGGLVNLVKEKGITDVIFVQCTFFVETAWHLHKIQGLMYKANVPIELPVDSVPASDSLKPKEITSDSL